MFSGSSKKQTEHKHYISQDFYIRVSTVSIKVCDPWVCVCVSGENFPILSFHVRHSGSVGGWKEWEKEEKEEEEEKRAINLIHKWIAKQGKAFVRLPVAHPHF